MGLLRVDCKNEQSGEGSRDPTADDVGEKVSACENSKVTRTENQPFRDAEVCENQPGRGLSGNQQE